MALDEFVKTWDGKKLEVAGSGTNGDALYQCVDLANGYIRDVLYLPIIEWTNAVDFPSKAGSNYDYIVNDPTDPNQIPTKGDLVIWKPSPGHIAVFLEKIDDNHFHSFDENFPLYSVCHIQEHDWTNVIGWLHPKTENTITIEKTTFENLVSKSTKYDEFVNAGFNSVQDVKNALQKLTDDKNLIEHDKEVLQTFCDGLQRQLTDLKAKLAALENQTPLGPATTAGDAKIDKIRPLVFNGWLIYLRSRGLIQTIINE